ncbi:MAG: hypothetical protein SFW63_03475 [Alphaproteobacteria bacterium]|nr:hypothetical protein [Alphaproteobacteria bacterium]
MEAKPASKTEFLTQLGELQKRAPAARAAFKKAIDESLGISDRMRELVGSEKDGEAVVHRITQALSEVLNKADHQRAYEATIHLGQGNENSHATLSVFQQHTQLPYNPLEQPFPYTPAIEIDLGFRHQRERSNQEESSEIESWKAALSNIGVAAMGDDAAPAPSGSGKLYVEITPENIERIQNALVSKRLRTAEENGEIHGKITRRGVGAAIKEAIESEIWGDLARDIAR